MFDLSTELSHLAAAAAVMVIGSVIVTWSSGMDHKRTLMAELAAPDTIAEVASVSDDLDELARRFNERSDPAAIPRGSILPIA